MAVSSGAFAVESHAVITLVCHCLQNVVLPEGLFQFKFRLAQIKVPRKHFVMMKMISVRFMHFALLLLSYKGRQ